MAKEMDLDSQNLLEDVKKTPSMIEDAYRLGNYIKVEKPFERIAVVGMGGSAIGGTLLKNYIESELDMPFYVFRNYNLPKFVDNKTLVFAVSYSGNTEETLGAYREARKRGCPLVAMASGGKLMNMAEGDRIPFVPIPKGMQPRSAYIYSFFPMLATLENHRLVKGQAKLVSGVINQLKKPGFEKVAKNLAEKLYEKTPIIYASTKFAAVAYRWRTQINENCKILAIHHIFPEQNHNELSGFENPQGLFHLIMLESALDHRRVQKKMKICEKIFRKTVETTVLNLKGENYLSQMFTAIYIGDLMSYYLALRYRVDPSPVKYVEELKKEMGPFIG